MSHAVNYDELASAYTQNRRTHPSVLAHLTNAGASLTEPAIVEIGCGTGNYIHELKQAMPASTCYGVDPSSEMLAVAKSCHSQVQFAEGSADRTGLPDSSIDLLFSVDVIHHIVDLSAYFQEAWRILKKGGQMCTVTDSADMIRRREPLSNYFPETVLYELHRYPRMNALKDQFRVSGFHHISEEMVRIDTQIVDLQPYEHKAFSALHLIPESAFEQGMTRMRSDFEKYGSIRKVSEYVMLWAEKAD